MSKELKKLEWKIIFIALKAMKETYNFMRGFGTITKQELKLDNLIKKIRKNLK